LPLSPFRLKNLFYIIDNLKEPAIADKFLDKTEAHIMTLKQMQLGKTKNYNPLEKRIISFQADIFSISLSYSFHKPGNLM